MPVNPASAGKQQGSLPVSKLLKMLKIPQWQILKLLGQGECVLLCRSTLSLWRRHQGFILPGRGVLDRWMCPEHPREEDKPLATISHVGCEMQSCPFPQRWEGVSSWTPAHREG